MAIKGFSVMASSWIDFFKLFLKNPMPIPNANKI